VASFRFRVSSFQFKPEQLQITPIDADRKNIYHRGHGAEPRPEGSQFAAKPGCRRFTLMDADQDKKPPQERPALSFQLTAPSQLATHNSQLETGN
jgi:hypothetical protein